MPAVPMLLTSLPFLNFLWFSKYSILALISWRTVSPFDSCFAFLVYADFDFIGVGKSSRLCNIITVKGHFAYKQGRMSFALKQSDYYACFILKQNEF